jgi:ABC-2 type transport system ATP-binding protein
MLDVSGRLRMDRISASNAQRGVAPHKPGQPLLEVASLSKFRGDQLALADVAFSAGAGEILGIIGPNGAGKTTMLECLAGVLSADSGEVRWRGKLLPASRRREAIFYVPDAVRPYQDQFVAQVLSFFAGVYGRSETDVAGIIAAVGLRAVLRKRVHSLSKGFGRRLILALGLLTPHEVLLMDEPFDGFDLRQTREMVGVIRAEAGKGRGLLLAIHQLIDAERICDRFVLLSDGHVRGSGTLGDLRACTGLPTGSLEDIFLALT